MLNKIQDNRPNGIVYAGLYETIFKLEQRNHEQAAELALAALELLFTDNITTDDLTIEMILENFRRVNAANLKKYNDKTERAREDRINKYKLREIAACLQKGMSQKEIAATLALTQQTVSYRISSIIKKEFPELLGDPTGEAYKNTNDTNDNINININNNINMCGASPPTPPEPSSEEEGEKKEEKDLSFKNFRNIF